MTPQKALSVMMIMTSGLALGIFFQNRQEYFANLHSQIQRQNLASAVTSHQLTQAILEAPSGFSPKPYVLLFAGDIMLSRAVGKKIQKAGDQNFPFLKIADTIRSADFAFANLENPISNHGSNQGSIYSFRADPKTAEGLTFAGFDAASIANNHIWDWGSEALLDTINILKEHHIIPLGAGKDFASANAPQFFTLGNTRLALLAFTTLYPKSLEATAKTFGVSNPDLANIKSQIALARNEADLVIVSLHWGDEYQTHSNRSQQQLARAIIDSGANLVIGHHPHVLQEMEEYHGGYIFYSLGNFIFDQNFSEVTRLGGLARVIIRHQKIESVEIIPIRINDQFQPEPATTSLP